MKNYLSLFLCTLIIVIMVIAGTISAGCELETYQSSSDILRIHIRANSNNDDDQKIKYQIKDLILNYIGNDIIKMQSKAEVTDYFTDKKQDILNLIDCYLAENNFKYKSDLVIQNEYFPTRVYGNVCYSSGNYDAVIIKLGQATGENWWCIAYPSLCFEDYQKINDNVVYKSRIMDIIKKINENS